MTSIINRIRRSGLLNRTEILKLKVTLVMFFLLVFGILTIPVSIFEGLSLNIRIIVPLTFTLLFLISFLLLFFNKTRWAMHFSIYTFLGLTYYYVAGSGQLYGYFLLFITLSVIIFYQDLTTYIIYGGAVTIFGIFFIGTITEELMLIENAQLQVSPLIYQVILLGFFIVFLIHFILKDSIEETLSKEYYESEKLIQRFQHYAISYVQDYEERESKTPLHEDNFFKVQVMELSKFIAEDEGLEVNDEDVEEMSEFYFFLHNHHIDFIMQKDNLSSTTKEYALQFNKYLMNKNNHMNSMLFKLVCEFKKPYELSFKRYHHDFDDMFSNRTNKIIALGLLYQYLRREVTQLDKWGRVDKVMTHQDIRALLTSKPMRKFISFEDMNFFLKNEHLFMEMLK
ncbi:MAG: hypothetical protein ACQEQA_00205 [Bacillota bacterium]